MARATYAVQPDVVLKAEYRWSESLLLETNIRPLGSPKTRELWHRLDVGFLLTGIP